MHSGARKHAHSPFRFIAAGLVLALAISVQSLAAQSTRFVAPAGDDAGDCTNAASPCETVGYAIGESEDGDSIELAAGEYTETVTISGLELTIRGAGDGPGGSILQAAPDSPDDASDRVITISSGANITIESLWIRHGSAASGGGIQAAGGSDLTLTDSTVSDNLASGGGGGIWFDQGELTISGSRILDNTASGTAAFTAGGGGIRADNGSIVTLTDSTVDGNLAVVHSGGIRVNGSGGSPSTLTVNRSTISNNATDAGTQAGNGGGIFANGATELIVVNSTLSGNSGGDGAAIFFPTTAGTGSRSLTLLNSTITNNLASGSSSAVRLPGSAVSNVGNTIIADQQSLTVDCNNPGGSIGNNLSSDSSCAFTAAGDMQNANAALGPLADNGGPTRTHTLQVGSAAIGAGDGDICTEDPVSGIDQRGQARDANDCAIGAVEAAPIEPPDPAPVVNAIAPDSGPVAGGTAVTISGENFAEGASVSLGSSACNAVDVIDEATIACTTPPGPEGPVDVEVENPDGQSDSLANGYTYVDDGPPEPGPILSIGNVVPESGSELGGTAVTVSGTGFQDGAIVQFGSSPCLDVMVVNDTAIDCTTPGGAAGPVDVSVTNPDLEQVVLPDGFLYLPEQVGGPVDALAVPVLDRPALLLLILLMLCIAVIRTRA